MAGLRKGPRCDKVAGETAACSFCPPAFPRIYKNEGVQPKPVSSAGASKTVKTLFMSLGVYLGRGEERGRASLARVFVVAVFQRRAQLLFAMGLFRGMAAGFSANLCATMI